ncbi:MAG: hypothetical protein WC332_02990 [Clostridia bacterium]|jgi:hypothetical protein
MPDIFDSISTSKGDIFDSIVPKEDIFDKIKGVGEAALTTGLGAVSWIPSGIVKASGLISGQQKEGAELGDFIQEKLSYQPKTETGKKLSGYVAAPFEYISEKSQQAGDWVYDKTGNPYLATSVRVAGEAIPFVAAPIAIKGVKGITGKVKPPEIDLGEVNKVPTSLLPEISRDQRVSPEFTKSVLTEEKPLALPEGQGFELANANTELIDRQTQMFRDAEKGIKTKPEPIKELPKEEIKPPKNTTTKDTVTVEKAEPTATSQAENVAKPVETAETPVEGKPAKAALDINKDLIEKGFEGLPERELARYNSIQKVEEVSKAQALVSNPDFFEMAKGNKPLPEDVHPQVLFNVAINEATKAGNIDMLMDLAKSPIAEQRSLAAQQLGASGWEKPINNIVKTIQEVKKGRESKVRSPQIKEKVRKVLNEEVKKINLSKEELSWDRFLDKIVC